MDKSEMLEALINWFTDGNQAKFAAKLGIPAQNISAWIKRGTYNAELIYAKCEGVSAGWLLSGEGEMLNNISLQTGSVVNGDHSAAAVNGNATVVGGTGETAVLEERIRSLEEQARQKDLIIGQKDLLIEEKERLIRLLMKGRE